MSPKYVPLRNEENHDNDPNSLNSNIEENQNLVDSQTTSLSDSEDDSDTIFEDSLSNPTTPQGRTLDSLAPTGNLPTLTPSNPENGEGEEEKPEPRPRPLVVGLGNDGVFSNLSAKPHPLSETRNIVATSSNQDETPPPDDNQSIPSSPLPNYDEAMLEPSPPNFNDVVGYPHSLTGLLIDDLLVEGLPVGGVLSFLWSGLIAQMFPYIGFLLTYLLHVNHAGRLGSTTGLGLTFLSEGLRIRDTSQSDDSAYHGILPTPAFDNPPDTTATTTEELDFLNSTWAAYLLMVLGWAVILRSVSEYVRLRKERLSIITSPESGI